MSEAATPTNVSPLNGYSVIELEFNLSSTGTRGQNVGRLPLAPISRPGQGQGFFGALRCLSLMAMTLSLRITRSTACYGTAAGLCAFFPRASKLMGLLSILSRKQVLGITPAGPSVQRILTPLRFLSNPFTAHACLWMFMPIALPGLWRSLMYWQRCVPLVSSFFITNFRAARARRQGKDLRADLLWEAQHEAAADRLLEILCDLKGFYLKLGQILATKTDMMPVPYTASLRRLLDQMPATPFNKVKHSIEKELKGKLSSFFSCVDPFPLASATVAQVHQARLLSGQDVVLKVQHKNTKRMMRADLFNMRLCCNALEALHINIGFDLASVVREYCEQVPLEFNFEREAAMAESIRATLQDYSWHLPILRQVMVPEMLLCLSTPRLLTMEHVDGVPLLDIAGMAMQTKRQLMSALVLAYGVMILCGGVFHSDPHPGNLLACYSSTAEAEEPDIKLAILDFGQVKELSDESRLRYALLVCALASREDHLVVATMREMGLIVENCSEEFEAIAGYILFDTRMDFPEAHQSPLDPMANAGWRSAKVPSLPQDLFMIVRVITLLRGIMHSLGVDISSAVMWRPLAMQTIAELSDKQQQQKKAAGDWLKASQQRAESSPDHIPSPSGLVTPKASWHQTSWSPQSSPSKMSAAAELADFLSSQQQHLEGLHVPLMEVVGLEL